MSVGKNVTIRNSGPFYRTQGCIRTTEVAMHAIAAKLAKDPLTFPSGRFRITYDLLQQVMPNRCDRRYLQILELAAREGEARVEDALRLLLASASGRQTIVDWEVFELFLKRCEQAPEIADVPIEEVSLLSFDQLLSIPGGVQ
jgi:hypothetical protein